MKADLHFHSTYSDGKLSVQEDFIRAKEAKLDVIALTDHDSVFGVEEMTKLGAQAGIKVIAGVELTTFSNNEPIHVLGYFPSYESMSREFIDYLLSMKETRYLRLKKMTEMINDKYHLDIDFNKIAEAHPFMLERPHLADAIGERLHLSRKQVFDKYIGDDCPCFIPSTKISVIDGIALIHNGGGLAILAHPYCYNNNDPMELLKLGFDGVEAFYGPVSPQAYTPYIAYAIEHHLLLTGGSDFHMDDDQKHSAIGSSVYGSPYVEELLKRLDSMK